MLILNKKSIGNQENQLFQAELEKFRPHQNRLLSTTHKQSSILKDLTKTYGALLQDKRVRADQQKYEVINRSRSQVMAKYRKAVNAFEELIQGLLRAQSFYGEMKDSTDNLKKNVDSFVDNRRGEGAQLLNQIEQSKSANAGNQASAERDRLQQLMERMSVDPNRVSSPVLPSKSPAPASAPAPPPQLSIPPSRSPHPQPQPQPGPNGYHFPPHGAPMYSQGAAQPLSEGYNPMAYPYQTPITPAPPSGHPYFSPMSATPAPQHQQSYYGSPPPGSQQPQPQQHAPAPHRQLNFQSPTSHTPQPFQYGMPNPYVPPPPPPGLPGGSQTMYPSATGPMPSGPGGYAQAGRPSQYGMHVQSPPPQGHSQHGQQPPGDPWAGLSAWK